MGNLRFGRARAGVGYRRPRGGHQSHRASFPIPHSRRPRVRPPTCADALGAGFPVGGIAPRLREAAALEASSVSGKVPRRWGTHCLSCPFWVPWGQEQVPEGVTAAALASLGGQQVRNWQQPGRGQTDTCACVRVRVRARLCARERGRGETLEPRCLCCLSFRLTGTESLEEERSLLPPRVPIPRVGPALAT